MQAVSSAWTAEERDTVRNIAHNLLVSWKKQVDITARTFTIGVSTIGGADIIGIDAGGYGTPSQYRYFDESEYVTSLGWERQLSMPTGGITQGMAEATIDNTSGRFTPRQFGGNSELFTAILPRRPSIINGGFYFDGISQTLPQFSGTLTKIPELDMRSRQMKLQMADYMNFFKDKKVDRTVVFTAESTDRVIETLLEQQGVFTSQYRLDNGINVIPFGAISKGDSFWNTVKSLVESENGFMYADEMGILRFENRQHWDSAPYNQIQRIITTAQVINAEQTDLSHIVNVVEIVSKRRKKEQNQLVWQLSEPVLVPPNDTVEIFADFSDQDGALPVLSVDTPAYSDFPILSSAYLTNALSTNTGSTNEGSVTLKNYSKFATSYKMTFQNTSSSNTFITGLQLWGRPAKVASEVYVRKQRDLSVTAYEEQTLKIENEFIQDQDWAESLAQLILEDFAFPENLQTITISAIPELELGDLVSWQGRHWRVYGIRGKLSAGEGYIQELDLVQRTLRSYFRIGISTIGGSDQIAP